MKIIRDRLNPLYDQYSNQENRLTHSLLHTIGSSNWLFSKFLKDVVGIKKIARKVTYEISTQKVPFSHGDNDPEQVESVPDAWIVDEKSSLGIAIEVKDRKNVLSLSQLRKHANRIADYKNQILLAITPDLREPAKIEKLREENRKLNVVWCSWDGVYSWLTQLTAKKATGKPKEAFLVYSLQEYLERRIEVLGFQGVKFPNIFNVVDAKPILKAMMEELEGTVKKYYKDLGRRRPAITTFSQESVWDCFGTEEGFTKDLHITFAIHERTLDISITIPNSAGQAWTRLKNVFSDDAKQDEFFLILRSLRIQVPHLFFEFNQRHFIARKFGIRDGYMEFDLDTLGRPFRKTTSKTKEFPIWLQSIKEAILKKKQINAQVMFKSRFFLNETKGIDKPRFIDTARKTVIAFKPLYKFLRKPS